MQDHDQEKAQKSCQPGEDAAEVVSEGAEDGVGGVARTTFEIAVAEMTCISYRFNLTVVFWPPGTTLAQAGRGAGRGCVAPRLGGLENHHDDRTED